VRPSLSPHSLTVSAQYCHSLTLHMKAYVLSTFYPSALDRVLRRERYLAHIGRKTGYAIDFGGTDDALAAKLKASESAFTPHYVEESGQ